MSIEWNQLNIIHMTLVIQSFLHEINKKVGMTEAKRRDEMWPTEYHNCYPTSVAFPCDETLKT